MIGIICETKEEIAVIQADMEAPLAQTLAGMSFVTGRILGHEITAVCTDDGKVNNAVCAEILLGQMRADALIGTGTCRGLAEDLRVGDVLVIRRARYFDVDATALGYQPGEVIGLAESEFEADEGLLAAALDACGRQLSAGEFREATILTGDRIITAPEEQEQLAILWDGDGADMEGAAIAQVAFLHQTPWLLLRAVAETPRTPAETGDGLDYLYFRENCIENFTRIMRDLLTNLSK